MDKKMGYVGFVHTRPSENVKIQEEKKCRFKNVYYAPNFDREPCASVVLKEKKKLFFSIKILNVRLVFKRGERRNRCAFVTLFR